MALRPANLPTPVPGGAARPVESDAARAARAAFFQQALSGGGGTPAAPPVQAAASVQRQRPEPAAAAAPAVRPVRVTLEPGAEPPRTLRPGSLVDIRV